MSNYQPVIRKEEVNDEHYYYVDDKFMPGVTTILHEAMPTPFALRQWIGEVGNEKAEMKLNRAAARGSAIHDACERLLRKEEVSLLDFPDAKDKKAIWGFTEWANEFKPDIKEIEFTVASQLGYAGTLDIFCYINDEPWIVDIKTSAAIYDEHKLQITAYQSAFEEMTGIVAKRGILHLNPRTKKGYAFETKMEIKKTPVTVADFMCVYHMYKMLNGGVIPEPNLTTVYPDTITLYTK